MFRPPCVRPFLCVNDEAIIYGARGVLMAKKGDTQGYYFCPKLLANLAARHVHARVDSVSEYLTGFCMALKKGIVCHGPAQPDLHTLFLDPVVFGLSAAFLSGI